LITVRSATPDDTAEILRIIRQLAVFEKSPGTVVISEDVLRADGFGDNRRIEVLLAEADGRVCGTVVLYHAYSSWAGAPTLTVHDLFVEEDARGVGAGRALLSAAAKLASERGCCRMDVNVLAWNTAARKFYETLGFTHIDEWLPYRLDKAGVEKLASKVPQE
jgi:GNAT superfamily N-acetyltransferase